MSLVVTATLFMAAGCGVRMPRQQTVAPPSPVVQSQPAARAAATAQPFPTALPPTPAVTPTPQDVTNPLLADGTMTPASGDLFATNPTSASLLTMQYPDQGFLSEQPRKQSGTADEQNPFLILFPELRRATAPAWLKEGVRVTYRFESASIAQKEGAEGSSGAGFAQYDLVALDRQAAVTSVRMYTDLGTGTLLPSMVLRFVDLPGAGEYWVNPKVLQDAESVANDNLAVVRMPQKAGGKTYQSVRFVYNTEGAEYVWAFDQSTGLLLFY
ncbi:MAG: hypothetical protein M1546_24435, partial [Chloroflexi bacterium]|nr:hypothetical protein [Chloroflexota bacterium]